jgi:ferrochelatase
VACQIHASALFAEHTGNIPDTRCAAACSPDLPAAGDLDTLLSAYDRDRRTLPAPVEPWSWGWTKSAETWNGRIAMVAIVVILLLEAATGQSFLNNIMAID